VRERSGRSRIGQIGRRERRSACTDVIDPFFVVVIRSCNIPRSVERVGGTRRQTAYAEECRHLGVRLGETKDVVDEEKNVFSLDVPKILGDGQRG